MLTKVSHRVGGSVALVALALVLSVAYGQATPTVFLADDSPLVGNTTSPTHALPVLFVHGHRPDSETNPEPHYRSTWQLPLGNLPSFSQTLNHGDNAGLGIEPYYIYFTDHNRSIVDDARDIGEAIELILQRHDPHYIPNDPNHLPTVQIVIIAYSKGTISTRLYLKSLVEDLSTTHNLPPPRQDFRPVSEFIAIAPPNHGTRWPLLTQSLAVRQLNNGYGGLLCLPYGDAEAADFIQSLNGHPIADSHIGASPQDIYPSEAPGSRSDGAPPQQGVLYLTLYADNNRDPVGGDTPQDDCDFFGQQQGRKLARNLAPDAVNMPVASIPGGTDGAAVHANTIHTQDVICLALYTAVHHRAPAVGMTCPLQNDIPIVPVPARASVMLTLDLSGSMLSPVCPGCATRLQVLQDAAEIFLQLWALVGTPQDQVGLAYFRTDVDTPLIPPNTAVLGPLLPNVATLINNVRSQQTSLWELTAMGGGLQAALNTLQSANNSRHVILFTDGMQNVYPMVQEVSGQLEISGTGTPQSNIAPTVPPTRLDQLLGTRVSVIGIGADPAFTSLLADIAHDTDGLVKFTTAPDTDLRRFFIEELVNALRGFSPQLVGYHHGVISAGGSVEAFAVDHGARKVVLKLSWQQGQQLTFRVEKDGVDLTPFGTVVDGPFYRFFALDLPTDVQGQTVQPGGLWQMVITGPTGELYEAAAIVDETFLHYDVSLGARTYQVGETLELELRLLADERPLKGTAQVTATILAPRYSVATLLSTLPIAVEDKSEPGLTMRQRRVEALLHNEEALELLRPMATKVQLSAQEGGFYRAAWPSVNVPGIYTAIFHVAGDSPELGTFQRTETISTAVHFARADRQLSALKAMFVERTAHGDVITIRLRPQDAYGNFLGPEVGHEIQVALSTGTVDKDIGDLHDGTYLIRLLVPQKADPQVTVTVAGDILFRGRLSELR